MGMGVAALVGTGERFAAAGVGAVVSTATFSCARRKEVGKRHDQNAANAQSAARRGRVINSGIVEGID
jgi:hypothetical protein